MSLIKLARCYDIITPESASRGDFAENGFVFESREVSLRELIKEVDSLGSYEFGSETALYSIDPEIDYRDGSERRESLHIDASPRVLARINRILKGVRK